MELPDISSKEGTKDLCTWHSMIHGGVNLTLVVEVAAENDEPVKLRPRKGGIVAKTTCFGIKNALIAYFCALFSQYKSYLTDLKSTPRICISKRSTPCNL